MQITQAKQNLSEKQRDSDHQDHQEDHQHLNLNNLCQQNDQQQQDIVFKHKFKQDDQIKLLHEQIQTRKKNKSLQHIFNTIKSNKKGLSYKDQYTQNLTVQIKKTNSESMIVQLSLGNFSLMTSIYRIKMKISHYGQVLGKGTSGNVFLMSFQKKKYAIKFIQASTDYSNMEQIYKQYFLAKIADHLQIGPEMPQIFGYDLIIFQNYAIFAMERCNTDVFQFRQHSNFREDLINALSTLHLLNICHCDIKPDNIGISIQKNKAIFLDYGYSKLLKQNEGNSYLTHFLGTYRYCSSQMKKIYFLKNKKKIDLYFNDAASLQNSLKQIFGQKQQLLQIQNMTNFKFNSNLEQQQVLIQQFINIARLKYFIFDNCFLKAKQIIANQTKLIKTVIKICYQQKIFDKNDSILSKQLIKYILNIRKKNKNLQLDKQQKDNFLKQPSIKEKIENQYNQIIIKLNNRLKNCKKFSRTDQNLCLYFNQFYAGEISFLENSIFEIFDMNDSYFRSQTKDVNSFKQFSEIWNNQIWMEKIFIFLDPCSNNTSDYEKKDNIKMRYKIIRKLYKYLISNRKINKQNFIGQQPFPEQIQYIIKFRYVILEFFEYFKQNPNVKFLDSIRYCFAYLDDFTNFQKADNFLIKYLKQVKQDIGSWIIKLIQSYLCKVILFTNQVTQYMKQIYLQIKNTQIPYKGKIIQFNDDQIQIQRLNECPISDDQSLYLLKQFALFIFDINNMLYPNRLQRILNRYCQFLNKNIDGLYQKRLIQSKLFLFKERNTNNKISFNHKNLKRHDQNSQHNNFRCCQFKKQILKKNTWNQLLKLVTSKHSHVVYSLTCQADLQFQKQNYHFISFNKYFCNYMLSSYDLQKQIQYQYSPITHMKLYYKYQYLINQMFWTFIYVTIKQYQHQMYFETVQYFLQRIPINGIDNLFIIDGFIRNIRQLSKILVFKDNSITKKCIRQQNCHKITEKIKITFKNLCEQANEINEQYTKKSFNVKLINAIYLVYQNKLAQALRQIQQILQLIQAHIYADNDHFWWIFCLMCAIIDPSNQYNINFGQIQVSLYQYIPHQQKQAVSFQIQTKNISSKQNQNIQIILDYFPRKINILVTKIFNKYKDCQIVYSNPFLELYVTCLILTKQFKECYQYLKTYPLYFENFHHHNLQQRAHQVYNIFVSRFCTFAPINLLLQICESSYRQYTLKFLSQNPSSSILLYFVYTQVKERISSIQMRKRLLILSVFGINLTDNSNKVRYRTQLYRINSQLFKYKTQRKQTICAKIQGKTRYDCNMKKWRTLISKSIQKIQNQNILYLLNLRIAKIQTIERQQVYYSVI